MKFKFVVLPMYLTYRMVLSALYRAGPEWWKTFNMLFYTHNFKNPNTVRKDIFHCLYYENTVQFPPHPYSPNPKAS